MDKKLLEVINEQIVKEFYSAYLYLAMSAFLEDRGLSGFSSWMQKQAAEEMVHGMKFFNFLCDRGEKADLGAIDKPRVKCKTIKDVFKETLAHEKLVTASINNIYSVAKKVDDTAAQTFLIWFIDEQVEEEKNASDILGKFDYIKEDSSAIIMLDKELGARAMPSLNPSAA